MPGNFDEDTLSDLHKDARGFRAGEYFWAAWVNGNDRCKQDIWDGLLRELDTRQEEEKAREDEATNKFETQVKMTIAMGAGNRETAIRWMIDAMDRSSMDKEYGGSYICFSLGLPYSYSKEFDAILKEETV